MDPGASLGYVRRRSMQGRATLLVLAVLAMLISAAPARAAQTFTVTGTADTLEGCQGTACPSIRSALVQASISAGVDTISIPAGDYQLDSALVVDNDVVIQGAGARTTTVRGSQADRVFDIPAGITATISHLTMSGGRADAGNGCWGGNLQSQGTLTLDHILATQGHACSGAGLGNVGGTMTVQASAVLFNSSDIQGQGSDSGGILNLGRQGRPANLTVRDTTVAFNTANVGGGVFSWSYEGTIPNVTTLERVTVAYNNGGGVARGDPSQTFGVRGSLVASNAGGNCLGGIASLGGNAESSDDCGFETRGGVGLSDELLDNGGETDTLALSETSSAIDAGGACAGADQRDAARPVGAACDAGAFEAGSGVRIDSGPADPANRRDAELAFSPRTQAEVTYECRLDTPSDEPAYSPCTSPVSYAGLSDGTYRFLVRAVNDQGVQVGAAAARTFRVDATPPDAPAIGSSDGGVLSGTAEPFAGIELLRDGAVVGTTTAGPDGRWSFAYPAGERHTYTVRATDSAGNASPLSAPLTVGAAPAQPAPSPTPTPTPGPVATPVPQKSVAGKPSGTVLVRVPGGRFVPLDPSKPIPLGSTIDAKKGSVLISAVLKQGGKVEQATFSDGIFKVTQTKTTTDLTLTEALARCPRGGKASAAAKKQPKSRKLWGSGSGSFRTRGQYSAATVRGTKWLVQDSCAGTLTRVTAGVVAVRDNVRRKTVILRAGKSYLARPKRR
jgi:Bacterial Ig domain